jgi:hypothetical protein
MLSTQYYLESVSKYTSYKTNKVSLYISKKSKRINNKYKMKTYDQIYECEKNDCIRIIDIFSQKRYYKITKKIYLILFNKYINTFHKRIEFKKITSLFKYVKNIKTDNEIILDLSDNLQNVKLLNKIPNISQLTSLILSRNNITKLSKSITKISSLTTLILTENNLTKLPKSINNLSKLQTLLVPENNITKLPKSLSKLSNLRTLNVSNNKITKIPKSLSMLSLLRLLDISKNYISIKKMQKIKNIFLYVSYIFHQNQKRLSKQHIK